MQTCRVWHGIKAKMGNEVENLKKGLMRFDKSNFAHVVYVAVFAIVAVILFAIFVIAWRSKKVHTPPFTKSPTAQLSEPRAPSAFRLVLDRSEA